MMVPVKTLKVIEIQNNSSIYLGTDPGNRGQEISCKTGYIERPRELDDYHLAGVYQTAGVPVEIHEVLLEGEFKVGDKAHHTQNKMVSDSVYEGLKSGSSVFVVGGTCGQAPGVAGGIRRAFGKDAKIGIIWMDAHGDINIPETSQSGMLGGMPFATVLGYCLRDWSEASGLVPVFDDRYAILTDARNFDKEEADNVRDKNLTIINTADFLDEEKWRRQVEELADKVDVLYLHIDADIIDGKYVPNHNTVEYNGPDVWPLLRNMRIVMETGKVPVVNLSSIYFDGKATRREIEGGQDVSILTGIRMTGALLGSWKNCPDKP